MDAVVARPSVRQRRAEEEPPRRHSLARSLCLLAFLGHPHPSLSSTLPSFRLLYLFISPLFSESLGQMPKTDGKRRRRRCLAANGTQTRVRKGGTIKRRQQIWALHARKRRRRRRRTFLIYSDKVVPSSVRSSCLALSDSDRTETNFLGGKTFRPTAALSTGTSVEQRGSARTRTAPISLPRSLNIFRLFAARPSFLARCPIEKGNSRGKGLSPRSLAPSSCRHMNQCRMERAFGRTLGQRLNGAEERSLRCMFLY